MSCAEFAAAESGRAKVLSKLCTTAGLAYLWMVRQVEVQRIALANFQLAMQRPHSQVDLLLLRDHSVYWQPGQAERVVVGIPS